MKAVLTEIERRLSIMFGDLAKGWDVAPSARLRLEGLLEAAVLADMATEAELSALISRCYFDAFAVTLADQWGEDWQQLFPFPQIPAMMVRAPVVPSTTD